ncbi:MAG: hypothetical protein V3V14_10010 [Saprospiraceae bacterium]
MSKSLKILLFLPLFCGALFGQSTDSKVSLIGDNEEEYELLIQNCSTMLLDISNNSMDKAYGLWTNMLGKMEVEAEKDGLDLKGVKIWINSFWAADGTINKIVYYPKPNSKNMDFDQISIFFEKFATTYTLPITSDNCFSHYGSASFPIFTKFKTTYEK